MINVSEYQDYREFLQRYYNEQKATVKSFSYREFARRANLKTSSFLFDVIQGRKNMTRSSILKVSEAIGLGKSDSAYFENLVFFNQAKTIQEKNHYYSKLIEIKRPVMIESINKSKYEFYEQWYHSVIREVIAFMNFDHDFARLGKTLIPSISEREAKQSIDILTRLGMITCDENGKYSQTDKLITAKPTMIDMLIIQKFQIAMLENAIKSYDSVPLHDRISTSTTFSLSYKNFELIKKKTREFQQDIMQLALIDNDVDSVYQITINVFPVSKRGQK